ncbi:MAG TPA: shikimate kinase [Ktedonobacterales bacterium]|jgi:2-phosphoglycerate kinase
MQQSPFDSAQLSAQLRHVRWIGGGSGAGKSTIARQLAADHGLYLYDTDAVMAEHARRSHPADTPLLHAFIAMDMDERWATRSPEVMFQTFHWFAGEGFDLIVEGLLALPEDPPILVEGFRLLPRLVAPLLSHPDQAVWLIPTPEFRRSAFDNRGSTWTIAKKTSKPEQALSNLLARDQLFTDAIAREATALQLPVIEVDGAISVDELATCVAQYLDLSAG